MARRYSRDNRGRFASGGSSGGGGGKVGATARGGRLRTAAGNKRATQTTKAAAAKPSGTVAGKVKRNPAAAGKIGKAKPTSRKDQLAAGAKKRNAQADRIDAKVKKLEGEYRSKDAAFYTQGAKPAGRDRMIAKSQQAAQLREQSAALRSKASNAEKMASKIRNKPTKSSGGNARLGRAIKNEAAGSTSYSRNPKGYQKQITALTAQQIYKTGDFMAGISVAKAAGKGFRLPRNERSATKAAAPKAARPSRFSAEDAGNRKRNAERLKAMPKDLRRAERTARLAQREVMATNGAVGGNVVGRRKSSTQSKINSIREGLMRAKGDKTGSIRNQVVKEAKTLRARMQTTGAGPRTGAQSGIKRRTARAAAPKNTTPNRTGQSKTLNKFNSRPIGTMVAGKGINLVPSTKRVPLQVQRKESDLAFARVATKAAKQRAAAPAKAAVRRTEANRTARALANQKRTVQTVLAKGGKRFSPTRKQKKSLAIADAASRFYSAKRVNSLPTFKVNTSKPGFRLPRNMR